jgi:signal transduction histidine kinase
MNELLMSGQGSFDPFLMGLHLKMQGIDEHSKNAKRLLTKIEKNWVKDRVLPAVIRMMDDEARGVIKLLKSQVNKKLEAFVHDFNNIITVVIGNIDMTLMSLKGGMYQDIEKYLNSIEEVSSNSRELIQSANVDINGSGEIAVVDKKLRSIFDAALKAVDGKRSGKVGFWPDIIPMTIHRYSADLNRILMNIIGNAYDAMAEKNYGKDQQASLHIYTSIVGSDLVIEICDNGIGMSQETIEKIFDENFSTKKEKGGKGIGLHYCQQIISRIGGSIAVKSTIGQKTIFALRIPLEAIQ